MSILAWIVLGLISGFIASKIVNKSGEGFFLDIVLGIVGAVVATVGGDAGVGPACANARSALAIPIAIAAAEPAVSRLRRSIGPCVLSSVILRSCAEYFDHHNV